MGSDFDGVTPIFVLFNNGSKRIVVYRDGEFDTPLSNRSALRLGVEDLLAGLPNEDATRLHKLRAVRVNNGLITMQMNVLQHVSGSLTDPANFTNNQMAVAYSNDYLATMPLSPLSAIDGGGD